MRDLQRVVRRARRARALAMVAAVGLLAAACTSGSGGGSGAGLATPATTSANPGAGEAPDRQASTRPAPRVTGPVAGRPGMASPVDLAGKGYVEEEFLLAGDASAYAKAGDWGRNGKWEATPGRTAAYTTRVLVRRPSAPAKFNGDVVVEWLNVSGGLDASPDFGYMHQELLRSGYIWVGVSAQAVGVVATAKQDPTRYKNLSHPGDAFAYDIYTQVGRAVRAGQLFGRDYGIKALIAAGESQSAIMMTTYVNAVDPLVKVYDGFLLHSRFAVAGGLGDGTPGPNPADIRDDIDVPVLVLLSETDLGFNLQTRQPDGERFRLWEIAGTAHADQYLINQFVPPTPEEPAPNPLGCAKPLNSANQHWVVKAAISHLSRWVRGGPPPPASPRVTMSDADPKVIARDEYGNALGGIRLPELEAPRATLSGASSPGSPGFCILFGSTTPFEAAQLSRLYPDGDAYVAAYGAAVDRLLAAGFILAPDAEEAKSAARATADGR
jgi:alpha/beta hydrolase family protein